MRDNKPLEARDILTRLIMEMPDASRPDDFALAAVKELDQLRTRSDIPAAPLSEADHLLWASVYQFNRDFGDARVHYQAVISGNPQSGTVPNATYQIGRGLYLEMKYEDAVKFFQSVADQFPQSQSARDALASLAASYLRLKRIDDAIATYKLSIARFPAGPRVRGRTGGVRVASKASDCNQQSQCQDNVKQDARAVDPGEAREGVPSLIPTRSYRGQETRPATGGNRGPQ